MSKKLVFSGYKYLEYQLNRNIPERLLNIDFAIDGWATKCEGKTEEEMQPFWSNPNWMVEIEEGESE